MADAPLDWGAWHADYDRDTPQRRRLQIVQRHITAFLDGSPRSPVRVISMCSGEGRDLLGALAAHSRRDVDGLLVELDPDLAAAARRRAGELGLVNLDVMVGDAGRSGTFADAVPADLVLVCGVFGNISDTDVEATVRALPELCAPDATVIWTRHRKPPDLTPAIRRWLTESGFEEAAFDFVPGDPGSVGVARFVGAAEPLVDRQLFRFNRIAL